MTITITLCPVPLTPRLLRRLERMQLVRPMMPTKKVLRTRTRTGAVDIFYRAAAAHGGHTLIAVGKRTLDVELYAHPENEDFILINPTRARYKPLYIVIAREKRRAFNRTLRARKLTAGDFFVVEWPFNDPRTCAFTMLKDTVHCEITVPGRGQHPVFFVAEPSQLAQNYVRIKPYRIAVRTA